MVSPSVPPPAVPFPPTNEGRTAIATTIARWTDGPRGGGTHGQGTSVSGGEGIGEGDEVGPDAEEVIDEEPRSVQRGGAAEEAVVHGEVAPQPAHELRTGYLAERPRPLASS